MAFFPLEHNNYKAIKLNRIIHELVWLFECFLKENLGDTTTLRPLIDKFLIKDLMLKKSFSEIEGYPRSTNSVKLQTIKELIDIIQKSDNNIDKQANCLFIMWLLRNYTSHNLSDKFFLFDGDDYTKKLFLSCFNCFLIVSSTLRQPT